MMYVHGVFEICNWSKSTLEVSKIISKLLPLA